MRRQRDCIAVENHNNITYIPNLPFCVGVSRCFGNSPDLVVEGNIARWQAKFLVLIFFPYSFFFFKVYGLNFLLTFTGKTKFSNRNILMFCTDIVKNKFEKFLTILFNIMKQPLVMFWKKAFLKIAVEEARQVARWKSQLKKFIFIRVVGLKTPILLKTIFFIDIIQGWWLGISEHLFFRTGFYGCFWILDENENVFFEFTVNHINFHFIYITKSYWKLLQIRENNGIFCKEIQEI